MYTATQPEDAIVKPEYRHGYNNDQIVYTLEALIKVLRGRAHETKLAAYPTEQYTIFFRDLIADICPKHEVWKLIAEIAETYAVEVVPNGLYCSSDHRPWTGETNTFGRFRFRHIKITNRVATAAAA